MDGSLTTEMRVCAKGMKTDKVLVPKDGSDAPRPESPPQFP